MLTVKETPTNKRLIFSWVAAFWPHTFQTEMDSFAFYVRAISFARRLNAHDHLTSYSMDGKYFSELSASINN